MVTRAEIAQRISSDLEILQVNLVDLVEIAEEWDELADGERASWGLDWAQLMGYLPDLHLAYRTGMMTPEQQAQYREVLAGLRAALPLLERLDLARPPARVLEQTTTA
ncbi:MAG: hypothetical protein HY690_16650 [Chloroflexi bacterium]|nr:hypothetical protein [Chloroflexota bacterium]